MENSINFFFFLKPSLRHIYIEKGQIKCFNFSFLGWGLKVTYNLDIFEKLRPPHGVWYVRFSCLVHNLTVSLPLKVLPVHTLCSRPELSKSWNIIRVCTLMRSSPRGGHSNDDTWQVNGGPTMRPGEGLFKLESKAKKQKKSVSFCHHLSLIWRYLKHFYSYLVHKWRHQNRTSEALI